jgi:AraC-like DNA-binding protein
MVGYSEFKPNVSLQPFIECIWSLKSTSTFFSKRERIIPGGRIEIFFNLGNPASWIDSKYPTHSHHCTGSYLLGPRNRHFFVEMTGAINMIGVRLRHGAIAAFTTMPAHNLLNQVVPLNQIFGKAADHFLDHLHETKDERQQVNMIERFLSKEVLTDSTICRTLDLISWVKKCEPTPINILSDKTGIHYKKLERTFSQYTGYSPKNFSRVIRFYEALRRMKKSGSSLTCVGLNAGYYDQPHFIRDFKAFTGKSPTQFHDENPTIANLLLQSPHV